MHAPRYNWGAVANRRGQSTVEYALVVAGLLAIIVGLAALVRAVSAGAFEDVVLESLSHRLVRGVVDVVAF